MSHDEKGSTHEQAALVERTGRRLVIALSEARTAGMSRADLARIAAGVYEVRDDREWTNDDWRVWCRLLTRLNDNISDDRLRAKVAELVLFFWKTIAATCDEAATRGPAVSRAIYRTLLAERLGVDPSGKSLSELLEMVGRAK